MSHVQFFGGKLISCCDFYQIFENAGDPTIVGKNGNIVSWSNQPIIIQRCIFRGVMRSSKITGSNIGSTSSGSVFISDSIFATDVVGLDGGHISTVNAILVYARIPCIF